MPFGPTKSIGSPSTGENPPQSSPNLGPSVPPSIGIESPESQPTEPALTPAPSSVPSPDDGAQGTGAKSSRSQGQLLWGLPVLVLLASPAVARLLIRGWHLRGGQPPASAAAAAWRKLTDTHEDSGREFSTGSPVEAVKTMESDLPTVTVAHLLEVIEVVQRSQFTRETPPVDQLPGWVKLLVRELRNDIPVSRRLLTFLLPASLWWSRNAGGGRRGQKSR